MTTRPEVASDFIDAYGGEVVAKPLASGNIERGDPEDDTVIYTNSVRALTPEWIDNVRACPVLCQARVNKQRDVRVTVVDSGAIAVSLESTEDDGAQILDIRRDNMRSVTYNSIEIPSIIETGIIALMSCYKLRFAAIDFVVDHRGYWHFLELNPNGQWAWLDIVGAADIGQLFVDALQPQQYAHLR